jgi:DNA-binding transcriptional LysR family regulator
MDLFQIETFLTVAREGSFSRAAKKLFRTQPAVSQTIRKLEKELGESLFDRSSRDGMLTDAGHVLQGYSEKLLNMRGEAIDALQELRQLHRGHLLVSANEFTCLYLLPVLDDFRRLYPMVRVTVQRALASHIPNDLLNHNTEVGMVAFNPSDQALRSIVVYADELAFVVPPKHPLARAAEVNIRQLGAENFVAHNVSSTFREKVLDAFRRRKVPLNMEVELPSIEAIKIFVARGNGVALLPGICVAAEVARGDLVRIPVPELRFERRIRAVYRRASALSHAARAFLSVAEAYAREHQGAYIYQTEK